MKTVSVREMKANWALIESQIQSGETFVVENHGRPTVQLLPAQPRRVLKWDDHLRTAAKTVPGANGAGCPGEIAATGGRDQAISTGAPSEASLRAERDERW